MGFRVLPPVVAAVVAVLVAGCAGPGICDEAAVMRQQETATQRLLDARDARARLEAAVAARYDEYLDTLDASARAVEEERAARLVGGAGVGFNWSRRGTVKALWSRHLRVPVELSGSAGEKAAGFLDEYAALFGLAGTPGVLEVSQLKARAQGEGSVIRYRQRLFDLPVFRAHLLLHVGAEGDIEHVAGFLVPEDAVTKQEPRLSATEAAALIGGDAATAQLGWFDPEVFGLPHDQVALAWRVAAVQGEQSIEAYIDAETGKVLQRRDLGSYDKHLEIFYCGTPCDGLGEIKYDTYCHTPPDAPVCPVACSSGVCDVTPYPVPSDVAWVKTNTDATDNYFRQRHSRDSWDNAQCQVGNPDCNDPNLHRMRVTTDWPHPEGKCGAEWTSPTGPDPKAQVRATSGWGCLDTIAHEFTHGIDSVEGKIDESGQYRPGSIVEAFGDVLGEMVEQHYHGSGPDWIHSTDCTCGNPPNKRNLGWPVAPGYEQPCPSGDPLRAPDNLANYRDDCVSGSAEEHFNATILGRAGFLMSRDPGLTPECNWGMEVKGVGISDAGDVWYAALTDYASANDSEPYGMAKLALSSGCWSVFLGGAGYDDCLTAISSAGLWSLQDDADIRDAGGIPRAVDGVVSVSSLPSDIHPFLSGYRLFYKEAGTNNLYFRHWSCFLGPCGWKYETLITTNATTGPTSVAWDPSPVDGDERIEVFYRNTVGDIRRIWIDSSGWHFWAWPVVVSTSDEPASAAVSNNTIFLTFKRSWTQLPYEVQWVTYDETNGWQGSFGSGFAVNKGLGPVVTSGDEDPVSQTANQLYMVHSTGFPDDRLAYRTFNFGTQSWSAQSLAGSVDDTAYGRPVARVFRGNLHIAAWHRASPSETELRYLTGLNPYSEWSFYGPLEADPAYGTDISLTVSTNGLFLWNVPANSAQGKLVSRAKQSQ